MTILTPQRVDEILATLGDQYTIPANVDARRAWVRYAASQTDAHRGRTIPIWVADDLTIGLVCVEATLNGIMFANVELYNENQRLKHGEAAVLIPNIFTPPQQYPEAVRQAGLRRAQAREEQRLARATKQIAEMEAAKAAAPPADPPPAG